jgi:hypothetical protein
MADDASLRKFFSHQGPLGRLRTCYEAGPTGYDLQLNNRSLLYLLIKRLGKPCRIVLCSDAARFPWP